MNVKGQEILPQWMNRVHDEWRIVDTIKLGRKDENGKVSSCAPAIFNRGDFVEVLATLEIFEGNGNNVKVHFCPEAIIRMVRADNVVSRFCDAMNLIQFNGTR